MFEIKIKNSNYIKASIFGKIKIEAFILLTDSIRGIRMGLRFMLGRAGTGKNKRIKEEIMGKLVSEPRGKSIFYIVPDQMTFDQEYALFKGEEIQGSIRAQVMSFSRLAWRVMQETGGATKQFISSIGVQMTLRKIIAEKEDGWKVFQKAVEKQGFLDDLERMITEFKRYQITPELLKEQQKEMDKFVHKEQEEVSLVNKLDDLIYIYEKLTDTLQGQYIDMEDQLQLLAEKMDETKLLEDAEIYIDGFHGFTPQELHIIELLLKKCKKVTVVLTLDSPATDKMNELDLFYQTKETYQKLKLIALENGIEIDNELFSNSAKEKFSDRPYFAHLEENFDQRPVPSYEGKVPVKIAEAVHPRAEVEGVAQEIIRLAREKGYRFRDMAVFIREADVYHDLIATVFADYDIPVFIDEKRTMLNHSLIEFIRSLYDMVESNWRYEAVFRVLKTGFIPSVDLEYPLTNNALDELENYVLEYGIRTRDRWFEEEWIFQRFRGFDKQVQTNKEKEKQQRINAYRKQIVQALKEFDERIRLASTVRELCETTYLLLERLQVPEQLEQMQEVFDQDGRIEKGREQEQVWEAIIQLFDEIVEMIGDEEMSFPVFRSTIDAGFEALEFAHVPPSMDHVIVGTVDRSRISGVKCAFLLGVNEGVWPMKAPVDGMINEAEREILATHGLQLAESNRRKLLDDWFYMYLTFTAPRDYLWVSYLLSDEEGKVQMPSPLIKRIQDLFPGISIPVVLQDPEDLLDAERFITTPFKTRAALTAQLARSQSGYPMDPIWLHVLNWYLQNENKYETTYRVLQSLYYQNKPVQLSKETVSQLYPQKINMSVSRLETYYRSSYQHFAQYTLGLQERKVHKLDAPDIGLLFHEALKRITEWVQEAGEEFSSLNREKANNYAQKAVSNLAGILQHRILHSSNRHVYIQSKLEEVIARAVYVLSEQARQSKFTPIGLELGFGDKGTLPAVQIPLPNGHELSLRGQIDRVDKALQDDHLLLRIIDYKSSETSLDLVEVYYGLALQMLTYLHVVLSHSENWLGVPATPAGVLYFHVHNPMISAKGKLYDEKVEEEINKHYKMQGLLLADETVVGMMDTSLESGHSMILPVGLKKNGGFYSSSKIAQQETFDLLQSHIRKLMVQAGLEITNGIIKLNPFQYKTKTGDQWDPYLSISQFDPSLEENNYYRLKKMSDDEVLDKMRQEKEDKS